MIELLNREHKGFSGINHVLIAIMLFVALFFIPLGPIIDIVERMKSTPIVLIISFLVIIGGALLADIDNLPSEGGSAASWSLGIFGSILSSLMVTVSSIVTSICHGKKDVKPNTQHRFFWHTLLIPVIIWLLVFFCVPNSSTSAIDAFTNLDNGFPFNVLITLLLIFTCVYVGSVLLLSKLSKFIPIFSVKPGLVSLILSLAVVVVCVVFSTIGDIRFYGLCAAIGYLFHLIGDLCADSGIPLLFPITGIFGKFWMRIKILPVTVKTGSTIESLLKIVFFVIDIILIYLLITIKLL